MGTGPPGRTHSGLRRSVAAAVLALLASTAGCNAVFGPSPAPSTPSEAPPGTAVSTPTTASPPPGLGAAGVEDPDRLSEAHATALRNHSFRMRHRLTVYDADGNPFGRERSRARVTSGGARYSYAWTADGVAREDTVAVDRRRTWSNRSVTFVSTTWGNRTSYRRYDAAQGRVPLPTLIGRSTVAQVFALVDTRVTGIERTDGTVQYRVASTDGPHELRGRNVSLTATIDASGLVRSLTLRYRTDRYGADTRVVRTLRFEDLDETTVPRPAWVDRAMGNTTGG